MSIFIAYCADRKFEERLMKVDAEATAKAFIDLQGLPRGDVDVLEVGGDDIVAAGWKFNDQDVLVEDDTFVGEDVDTI
jgi:hypothetical protein